MELGLLINKWVESTGLDNMLDAQFSLLLGCLVILSKIAYSRTLSDLQISFLEHSRT